MTKITVETLKKITAALTSAEAMVVEQALAGAAFNTVADPNDWRNPIDASIEEHGFYSDEFVAWSVEFVTASKATLGWEEGRGTVVKAVGYRNGPAGP